MASRPRLNPHYPAHYLFILGQSYFVLGQNEESIAAFERAVGLQPKHKSARRHLIILYNEAGRKEESQAQLAEFVRLNPKESLKRSSRNCAYYPVALERFIGGLRRAGYPETSKSAKL